LANARPANFWLHEFISPAMTEAEADELADSLSVPE
jgi:hypothetical protein